MSRKSKALLGLLLFNGFSATGGGVALMTDWIPEQASWVRHTDFPSNYFPGVILMAVVGGSSLIGATAMAKRSEGWQLASIVAGTVMVFWIIGEVASIRGFHFLQVIYLVTGALVVLWTPARSRQQEKPRDGEHDGQNLTRQGPAAQHGEAVLPVLAQHRGQYERFGTAPPPDPEGEQHDGDGEAGEGVEDLRHRGSPGHAETS